MQGFKNILFPVDLSEVSEKIAPFVEEIAERFDAGVHVLFVARIFEHFNGIYVDHHAIETFEGEIVKGAEKKLTEFVEASFKDRHCIVKVFSGEPSDQILKYVRSEGMDLIVMGTHGRKGIDKILLGSVADYVIKNSPVPVVTVNPYLASKSEIS